MIVRKLKNVSTIVTGKSHISKGSPCQDRTRYVIQNNTHVLSLSDGAGSRTYSQYGAEIVTQAACDYFSSNFDHAYLVLTDPSTTVDEQKALNEDFLNYLNHKIEEFLRTKPGMSANDLLCTLEFVAIKGNHYIAGHCGDGVIGVLTDFNNREKLQVLSHPDNGAASNITFFINDKSGATHLRFYTGNMAKVEGFILMSDGPEEVLYNKVKGLSPNTSIFFNAVRSGTTKECKEIFDKVLSEKIAEVSYDDLSVNVLVYTDFDLDKNNNVDEINEFFDAVFENQIVIESGYYATIDLCRNQDGHLLRGSQVVEKINKLKGQCV